MALNPRNVRVFYELESTPGVAVFPANADNGFFVTDFPNANMSVAYTESPEIKTSLNVSDQTPNRPEGGTFSVSTAIRPNVFSGTGASRALLAPQGENLLKSLQGLRYVMSGAVVKTSLTAVATTVELKSVVNPPPTVGVIRIGSELILYTGRTYTAVGDVYDVTLYGCTRGYDSTTAATAAVDDAVVNVDRSYVQQINKPTYTLWFMYDNGLMKCCAGAAITDLSFSVSNAGYPTFDMQGSCFTVTEYASVTLDSVSGSTIIVKTGEGARLAVGLKIYNSTRTPSPVTSDIRTITAITGDSVVLDSAPDGASADGDIFKLWLPAIPTINNTVKSLKTKVYMKEIADALDPAVRRHITTYKATVSAPMYLFKEEITENAIDDYTFEKRNITGGWTEQAKASNIDLFNVAAAQNEKTVVFMLGDGTSGNTCYIVMSRCTVQIPTMEISEPLITRSVEVTALDTSVEDSFQIIFT